MLQKHNAEKRSDACASQARIRQSACKSEQPCRKICDTVSFVDISWDPIGTNTIDKEGTDPDRQMTEWLNHAKNMKRFSLDLVKLRNWPQFGVYRKSAD